MTIHWTVAIYFNEPHYFYYIIESAEKHGRGGFQLNGYRRITMPFGQHNLIRVITNTLRTMVARPRQSQLLSF